MRNFIIVAVGAVATAHIKLISVQRAGHHATLVARAVMQLRACMRARVVNAVQSVFQPRHADHFFIERQSRQLEKLQSFKSSFQFVR